MPSTLLLADDSDVIRAAILRLLKDDPTVELAGEATSFAETIRMAASLKPNVLLLDLYMPDEDVYPPSLVTSHISADAGCTLAMSLSNDDNAKSLAASLGAKVLLDKSALASQLLPAIKLYCSNSPQTGRHPGKQSTCTELAPPQNEAAA